MEELQRSGTCTVRQSIHGLEWMRCALDAKLALPRGGLANEEIGRVEKQQDSDAARMESGSLMGCGACVRDGISDGWLGSFQSNP